MKTPLETRGSRANDGRSARLGKKQPDGTHAHRIAHVPRIRPLPPHVQAVAVGALARRPWAVGRATSAGWGKGPSRVRKCMGARISACLVIPLDRRAGRAYSYWGIQQTHSGDGGQWTVGGSREPVAIIGMACRLPGARDPAEFYDLAVAGRGMFQPATALPGRPLRAALLDDWSIPQIPADDVPVPGRAAGARRHAGQPAGGWPRAADADRGGGRPRRGGPLHRGGQWRRGGKPGPFGKLTG